MKSFAFGLFILLLSGSSLFSQVKITTTSHLKINGIITENKEDTLKLINEDKIQIAIPRQNIAYIEETTCYISKRNGDKKRGRISSINDKTIVMDCEDGTVYKFDYTNARITFENEVYPFLGATLLTPAALNINFGTYISKDFALSLSGGYWGTASGLQANFLLNLSKNEDRDHNIGICWGTSHVKDVDAEPYTVYKDWNYFGAIYELNYHGLFIQPGISFGTGDYSSPQLLFQIGYVYRFND